MKIPVVSRETSLMSLADLLREEIDDPSANGYGCLINGIRQLMQENPNVIAAVDVMMSDEPREHHNAALIGMIVTYRALKAQFEVESLERLNAA